MKRPEFRRLKKKLGSTAGESLVEVLVSLLIAGMAILMLGQAVVISVRMIHRSSEVMTEYYSANNGLASRSSAGGGSSLDEGDGVISVTWANSGTEVDLGVELNVKYYVNRGIDGSEVVSYGLIK